MFLLIQRDDVVIYNSYVFGKFDIVKGSRSVIALQFARQYHTRDPRSYPHYVADHNHPTDSEIHAY
jgi:hypothetical protein